MEREEHEAEDRPDFEQAVDEWNLPRSPLVLAVPPLENWPVAEPAFEEGLAEMRGGPLPAA